MKNILMNTEMTKAILDGRKVQTRRVIKFGLYAIPNDMNEHSIEISKSYCDLDENNHPELKHEMIKHAKYQIGETIWVREPAEITSLNSVNMIIGYHYGADKLIVNEDKKMSIPERFIDMSRTSEIVENFDLIKPKWIKNCQGIPNGCIKEMARIFLKVTNVRVEKLQDISYKDIKKEGVNLYLHGGNCGEICASVRWQMLWNKTAPKGYKWEYNPYVFVYEFEMV